MSDNKKENKLDQELDNFLGTPQPKQDDCNGDL